jgi:desulfoferrodoxin (superoxide reductase-like protein)
MKGKITKQGCLQIERAGKMVDKDCPFVNSAKKTGQMIEFEEETGESAIVTVKVGFSELQFQSDEYVQWIESELLKSSVKATAYDRIMSGGKKTLKEWANIFGKPFATNMSGNGYAYHATPTLLPSWNCWYCAVKPDVVEIPWNFIDYTGDWQDSLTLPDGWKEAK